MHAQWKNASLSSVVFPQFQVDNPCVDHGSYRKDCRLKGASMSGQLEGCSSWEQVISVVALMSQLAGLVQEDPSWTNASSQQQPMPAIGQDKSERSALGGGTYWVPGK